MKHVLAASIWRLGVWIITWPSFIKLLKFNKKINRLQGKIYKCVFALIKRQAM